MLFQIVDDILDVTGTDAALGKPRGSDERHGKRTYVSEYGLDGARELAAESHAGARAALAAAAPTADGRRRATSGTSPTSSGPEPHERPRLLDRIDRPQDLHGLSDDGAPAGRPGGPRADHRHDR